MVLHEPAAVKGSSLPEEVSKHSFLPLWVCSPGFLLHVGQTFKFKTVSLFDGFYCPSTERVNYVFEEID